MPEKKAAAPRKPPAAAKAPRARKKPTAAAAARDAEAPAAAAPAAKAAPPKEAKAPVHKERIVFPKELYEARKDEIKAPVKEHGLKWQFLGEGKGRYAKEGVNVFVMFTDQGVDYSVWGDDQATVDALLAAWRRLVGKEAFAAAAAEGEKAVEAEAAQKESEAMRLWRLQEPQRRPGEPDFFFRKRTDEWRAKKPAS